MGNKLVEWVAKHSGNPWDSVTAMWHPIALSGEHVREGRAAYDEVFTKDDHVQTHLLIEFVPTNDVLGNNSITLGLENWFPNTSHRDLHVAIYTGEPVIFQRAEITWLESNLRTKIHLRTPIKKGAYLVSIEMEVPLEKYQNPIRNPVQPINPCPPGPRDPCRV